MMKTSFACLALLLVSACSGGSDTVPDPSSSSGSSGTASSTQPTQPPSSSSSSSSSSGSTSSSSSGSSGNPPVVGPPATPADCDQFGAVVCQKLTTCNAFAGQLLGSACAERYASLCKARISAPSSGWTQTGLNACRQAFATATCDVAFGDTPPPACELKGGLALGAACAFDEQCASGECSADSDSCGQCIAKKPPSTKPPTADLGETCDNAGQTAPRCDSLKGLWCDATKKCAPIPLAAVGQACGFLADSLVMCAGGGRCAYGANGQGTCVAEVPVGGSCTKTEECAITSTCFGGKCGYPTAADLCK